MVGHLQRIHESVLALLDGVDDDGDCEDGEDCEADPDYEDDEALKAFALELKSAAQELASA
jgi:hypothetical protein